MNHPRARIGWLCLALGFALIVMLVAGIIDPIGMHHGGNATSFAGVFARLLPSVLLAVLPFALGLWLIKGARKQ